MSRRDADYPVELESQFILRLPEEPAKALRELLQSGENFKNRFTIRLDNEMRNGEVRFDNWMLHGKIVDLPTIVESLKTIDRKSVYKTADISQIMICKNEPEPNQSEEEAPAKNKKKDPFKVDKKFLYPHGITPPTKNIRKRRFRKTLKKKSAEAPEIEKEVKRLLRADFESESHKWEIINEEVDQSGNKPEPSSKLKSDKLKSKKEQNIKKESLTASQSSSKVEDIFGGALSDSDLEDENVNVDIDDSRISTYDNWSDSNSVQGSAEVKSSKARTQFRPDMFHSSIKSTSYSDDTRVIKASSSNIGNKLFSQPSSHLDIDSKLQQITVELEELKQRKIRTQNEISGLQNMTLRQRFQDILQTINKDIMFKEQEYKKLQSYIK